jgi:hypothetical protein
MKKLLYFLHIPKTAGTSLNNILKSKFETQKVYPFATYHQVFTNSKLDLDSYDIIAGHFTMSFIQNLKSTPNIITVFRNPISRVVSAYNHFMREPEANFEFNYFKKCNIKKALQTYPWLFSNQQVKHLGWNQNILTVPKYKIPIPFSIENWKEFHGNIKINEIYKKACENLEKLFLFGFTDRIDEFINNLFIKMNWELPFEIPSKNKAKDNQITETDLSPDIIEIIEKLNEHDIKLYQHARKRYKEIK